MAEILGAITIADFEGSAKTVGIAVVGFTLMIKAISVAKRIISAI
jgi:hypothetical protein